MGILGIEDMLGFGDIDGIEGIGMFFIPSVMAAQQPLSPFAWVAVAAGPIAPQQLWCGPECAMRR